MGYTVELWATPPGAVLAGLTTPQQTPPAVDMPDEVEAEWASLAAHVADVVRSGGGPLMAEHAHVVAANIRAAGFHYGSLDHTSSGGEEFRDQLLLGSAAARYGRDVVAQLLIRDLAGLSWEELPLLGHLTAGEVAEAAASIAGPVAEGEHPDDREVISVLDAAIGRAARFGLGLHSIYG